MSDQELGHGHHAITLHGVKQLFESFASDKLLGLSPNEFFHRLDVEQAKADGVPDRALGTIFVAIAHRRFEDLQFGSGATMLPSWVAPDVQREHAVADPKLTAQENLAAIKGFIVGELVAAKECHARGDQAGEFKHLGRAAHCLEDGYSSAHIFRDPTRASDPFAPVQGIMNFSPVSRPWTPDTASNTHNESFDSVPTVPGDGSLARSTDQAGAHALRLVFATYINEVDSGDLAAARHAFEAAVNPLFSGDGAVVLDRPDAEYHRMEQEHYRNEQSIEAQEPARPEVNGSSPQDVASYQPADDPGGRSCRVIRALFRP